MATMIVKTQVEATPTLIAQELTNFVAGTADQKFPFERGTFLRLNPEYLKSIGGMEDMPVLLVSIAQGTPLGMIAVYKADSTIILVFINKEQVIEPYQVPSST